MYFQDLILKLQTYWASRNCILAQGYDHEVGAGEVPQVVATEGQAGAGEALVLGLGEVAGADAGGFQVLHLAQGDRELLGLEILEEPDRPAQDFIPEPEFMGELRAPHLGLGD